MKSKNTLNKKGKVKGKTMTITPKKEKKKKSLNNHYTSVNEEPPKVVVQFLMGLFIIY